jgi:phosphatidyl-myo-inositol dimannoside synthase
MPKTSSPPALDVPRVLVVTNDFPPRIGGVQQYEWNLVRMLPSDRVAVLAPNWPGWREHDASQAFAIHRWPARFMWPTADLERRVRSLVRGHRADVVLFGQGLPLPLIGPSLAEGGIPYAVLTHGYEYWMARLPGLRPALAKALGRARAVTAIGEYTAAAVRRAMPDGRPLTILSPAVDERRFTPAVDGSGIRARLGIESTPAVLCVSRLVPRKGQDILVRGMDVVRRVVPSAVLVIVGDGEYRPALERMAARMAPRDSVVFAGGVSDADLPAYYAACDVFAMPCRSRWAGLEVEGFGIVFLEAGATAKPVVAGRSGGAAEAVVDGVTGLLVEGTEPKAVALAVARLLKNRDLAESMGIAARARIEREFTWRRQVERLAEVLREAAGNGGPPPAG